MPPKSRPTYESFLVVDVEATCVKDIPFGYPNEIIEWPVCLMRWQEQVNGSKPKLVIVDEFRSYVRPIWRPQLSNYCTELTGITQADVDGAPTWLQVMVDFERFLVKHELYDPKSKAIDTKLVWCCDGPWDLKEFFAKQIFIAQFNHPSWMPRNFMNVRQVTQNWALSQPKLATNKFSLVDQLCYLGLGPFEGRLHCGIDDTRNVCRILARLASFEEGSVILHRNESISTKKWPWMGQNGRVLEHQVYWREWKDQFVDARLEDEWDEATWFGDESTDDMWLEDGLSEDMWLDSEDWGYQ